MMLQNKTLTSSSGIGIIFLYLNHNEERNKTPVSLEHAIRIKQKYPDLFLFLPPLLLNNQSHGHINI